MDEQLLDKFTEAIHQMDKQDLEAMLIDLAWNNYSIETLVLSVVEDAVADDWGKQD